VTLPYLAGLDGLKGVALLAVLAFAHGVAPVRGGFLAISTAFTLSGFVLAALLLAGWSQPRRPTLTAIWERRARRLLPPLYAVVLLVVALQTAVGIGAVPTVRGDTWAALGLATNWRLAFPGEGFAPSFTDLSPLSHLWPVAIIAQLALLLPLVFVGVMAVVRRRWRIAGALFALAAMASFAAAWNTGGPESDTRALAYYGTHTRAGEVLVGVVLAYALLTPRVQAFLRSRWVATLVRSGGLLALLALILLWVTVPLGSPSVFQGITLLNSLLTAWVVLAVTVPGPTARCLGTWPLRKLGVIGFGAFLLHWPVFAVLDGSRSGLDGEALFGLRVAATLVAGTLLYAAIEHPVRRRLRVSRAWLGAALLSVAAVLAGAVLIVPVNPPENIGLTVDTSTAPGQLEVVVPTAGDGESARILVVGDQTAASIVAGFRAWNEDEPDVQFRVDTHVTDDCPLGGPDTVRRLGETQEPSSECRAWRWRLPETLDAADHDVIVVSMGVADVGERRVDGEWSHLGQPAHDRWMEREIDGLADVLSQAGAPVLWLTAPHLRLDPAPDDPSTSWSQFDDNDPHRMDRLNSLIGAAIAGRSGFDRLDLNAWLYDGPGGQFNPDIRRGDVFTDDGAAEVVSWLAPQILDAAGLDTTIGFDEEGDSDKD
jgi:peptidoglycan/LPS O-acetylase OafA/YrhL